MLMAFDEGTQTVTVPCSLPPIIKSWLSSQAFFGQILIFCHVFLFLCSLQIASKGGDQRLDWELLFATVPNVTRLEGFFF